MALAGMAMAGPATTQPASILDATAGVLSEHSARHLMSATDQAQVRAVGHVRKGGGRHCTGTLVAPDLVLTAAHCVASAAPRWVAPPYRVTFHANWRNGTTSGRGIGIALAVGEGYTETADIGDDLALIRLKDPIPAEDVPPIAVVDDPVLRGRVLSVYSYGYDAPQVLAKEAGCRAIASHGRAMVTSCEAVGGVSGSPVMVVDESGATRVAAVVSSMLRRKGGKTVGGRAIVVPVDQARLERMISRLSATPGG